MAGSNEKEMTFWEHLDELRKIFFRIITAVLLFAGIAFIFKDFLFNIILAPQRPDFILYRLFNEMARDFSMSSLAVKEVRATLINTELTAQFMTHISVSVYAGILLASPYIIYLLFGFISPALHTAERHTCLKILLPAFLLFLAGILLSYYLIFPLSFRFLANYQVSESVVNMISLSSYISCFTLLSLLLGAAFEIPVVAYLLAKLQLIHTSLLKKYRKHAFVGLLVLSAVITPTTDIFTLLLVSLPLYLLYELSIWVVARTGPRQVKQRLPA